jgi:hypothetical protein
MSSLMDSIRNNTHIINAVPPNINNTIINNISKINLETIINELNQTSLINTNNVTNNTMLNDSIYKNVENSIIIPPIREHIINATSNHLESTSLANNSNYSLINEKNVNNLTSFHETDILENKLDSNNNKTNSVNNTDVLINSTINEKPVLNMTKNKIEPLMIVKHNNNDDLLSLIINILFPIICISIIIYIIYYCIKRRIKRIKNSNTLDHNNLNKVRLKTSSKLSYKKIQNTSSLNIIDPNNMSMSEIKVQNINNENLMSRISAVSSSSVKKKIENKNNNVITGKEEHKKDQN